MSNNSLGVVVVGCGAIGGVHAQVVADLAGAELVALVDVHADAAAMLADRIAQSGHPRPRACATIEDALSVPGADLVVLTTPSGLHASQAATVLDARRHLLIEKPLDTDLSRARRLVDHARAARADGVVTSVVSQHRFDASSRAVAEAVSRDRLGRLTSAIASTAWWRSQSYYDSADWRGTREFDGGGALMNQSVHMVDLLLSFLGRPREVFGNASLAAHSRIDVEDSAVATVTFESGALATVHATTAAYPGLMTRIQLMGTRGSAIIEDDELTYFHVARSSDADVGTMGLSTAAGNQADTLVPPQGVATERPAKYQLDPASHRAQYADLLQAIDTGRAPLVTLDDAFHALALIKAVYVAGALRRPVAFDDVLAGIHDDVELELDS